MLKHSFLLSLLSLLFVSCISEKDGNTIHLEKEITIGDKVPAFIVYENDNYVGEYFDSAECIGMRTLLVFFNTGCGDCQRELPKINVLWETIREIPDVQIITIAREQGKAESDKYWIENNFSLPKYVDPEKKVFYLFANYTIPRLYFVDEKGIITWMAVEQLSATQEQELYNLLQ